MSEIFRYARRCDFCRAIETSFFQDQHAAVKAARNLGWVKAKKYRPDGSNGRGMRIDMCGPCSKRTWWFSYLYDGREIHLNGGQGADRIIWVGNAFETRQAAIADLKTREMIEGIDRLDSTRHIEILEVMRNPNSGLKSLVPATPIVTQIFRFGQPKLCVREWSHDKGTVLDGLL